MFERIAGGVLPVCAIVTSGYAGGRRKQPGVAFAKQIDINISVPALASIVLIGNLASPAFIPLTLAMVLKQACYLTSSRKRGAAWG